MVYIHNLAEDLQSSAFGCKLGQVPCGGILQADDIALMALTQVSLQKLLNMCEDYGKKWRFKYNPAKCKIIVFNESQRSKERLRHERKFLLYGATIEEVSESTHVGVVLNAFQNNTQLITNCVSKIRGGLMAIIGCGATGLSCSTAIKLYKTIVLPRGLYASELWYKLNVDNLNTIERAHRFCLKYIQKMPSRTKTIIVQSMVNVYSLETYIDISKLKFLRRLCALQWNKLAKKIFIERLYQQIYTTAENSGLGFIPDMLRVLMKYGLEQYLHEYTLSSRFPSKSQWSPIVALSVKSLEERNIIVNFNHPKLKRFAQIYSTSLHVHPIWCLEHKTQGRRQYLLDFAKLNGGLCDFEGSKICIYCDKHFCDYLNHYIHSCTKYDSTREFFWCLVLNEFSVSFSSYLYNLMDEEITEVILGRTPDTLLSNEEHSAFLKMSAKTWQILSYERELPFY
jgi:hypothetical protein